MKIKSIYRFPVKSLPGEAMKSAELVEGVGIPGDRAFAFAKAGGPASTENTIRGAEWRDKSAFHVLASEPKLALIMCRFDGSIGALNLTFPDGSSSHTTISDGDASNAMGLAVGNFLGLSKRDAPVLVHARKAGFFDTLEGEISILNLASLRELEKVAGTEINPLRFRPNIIMDGIPAWQELGWAGKTGQLGNAEIYFTKPTGRCLATHANPETGERDLKTMHLLKNNFGHTQMGVYAHIRRDGEISREDTLELA
ncbi:MAG: MOSC domain-containing protein [Rhodospirillaceae bacterium]|nr:MOSC domain-containing protein [Rhodospirillaceae bacterium]